MRRQISVIKGCKVDLQLAGPERSWRWTLGQWRRAVRQDSRINLFPTDAAGARGTGTRYWSLRSPIPSDAEDRAPRRTLRRPADGNTGHKTPTMERRMQHDNESTRRVNATMALSAMVANIATVMPMKETKYQPEWLMSRWVV